jgi:hypothetical protein
MTRYALVAILCVLGCGPACPDPRCSLTSTPTHVERADYTHLGSNTPDAGVVAIAPDAGAAAKPAQGSGAPVVAAGSGAGSGSAAPPVVKPPTLAGAAGDWMVFETPSDKSRIFVVTKSDLAAGAAIKFEFIKVPESAPFAIHLEVKHAGAPSETRIWNDCSPDKPRCDVQGMKSYVLKATGAVSLAARTNWTIIGFADQGPTYQISWKNNLSADVLTIRLYK